MRRLDDTTLSIAAAIALVCTVGIGLSLSLPLLSLEMERIGVSATASGLAMAVGAIASIVFAPFVPRVAGRVGIGRLIALAIVGAVASLLAFKLTMNYWAWLPIRVVYSLCLGTLFILSEFWISAAAPQARRGFIMGIYATVLSLGFAIGPALLAVVGTSGWAPYLFGSMLFLLAALPLVLARGRWPSVPEKQSHAVLSYLVAAPLAVVAGFASGALETSAIAMLPVMGVRLGYDATTAALFVSAMALGNVVTQIPLGWLSDRIDRRRLLRAIAAIVMGASGVISLVADAGAAPLLACLFVWGGFTGAFYTVGLAHLSSRFRMADLVGANAAFIIMFNVGMLAGPPLAGVAVDKSARYGFGLCMAAFALLVVAAAVHELRRQALEGAKS